jgi:hypothetical protein
MPFVSVRLYIKRTADRQTERATQKRYRLPHQTRVFQGDFWDGKIIVHNNNKIIVLTSLGYCA